MSEDVCEIHQIGKNNKGYNCASPPQLAPKHQRNGDTMVRRCGTKNKQRHGSNHVRSEFMRDLLISHYGWVKSVSQHKDYNK